MSELNRVEFIGYVGVEPEKRRTQKGFEYCNLSIAIKRLHNEEDGTTGTTWINIAYYGSLATKVVIPYVHKGSKVYVSAQVDSYTYTDEEGNERKRISYIGRDIQILSYSKNEKDEETAQKVETIKEEINGGLDNGESSNLTPITDNDLPF